jgi:hypothetical protein
MNSCINKQNKMYLRSNINFYENNNYCNIVNITKAILAVTSKVHYYDKIECNNQKKIEICTSMKKLFENSYVIPHPHFTNIVNVLEKSVMTILSCNDIEINKIKQSINYLYSEVVPTFIIIIIILYIIKKKYKLQ